MPYSGSRIRPFPGELLFQWKLQIEKECIWSWRWPPALGSPKPLARPEQVREKLHQQEVQDSLGKGEGQISRPRKEQVLSLSSLVAQTVKNLPCSTGDVGWPLGGKDSLEKRRANPLQYSCLQNSMDREVWQATDHGITKSWTRLSD